MIALSTRIPRQLNSDLNELSYLMRQSKSELVRTLLSPAHTTLEQLKAEKVKNHIPTFEVKLSVGLINEEVKSRGGKIRGK